MGREYRRFTGGEVPEPRDLNWAYSELRRFRRLRGAGGVEVSNPAGPGPPSLALSLGERVDIQLTGAYSGGYPWAEVLLTPSGTWSATGRTGGPASGDPAFERRTGDATLASGATVYHAVRSAFSNQLLFPNRSTPGGPPCHPPSCPSVTLPSTLNLTDRTYGSLTITRVAGTCRYTGCMLVTILGHCCAGITGQVPMHYMYDTATEDVTVSWPGTLVGGGWCPKAGVCADATNGSLSTSNRAKFGVVASSCSPYSVSWEEGFGTDAPNELMNNQRYPYCGSARPIMLTVSV